MYWLITAFHLIPSDLLFQDYNDPKSVQWNWSFVFLDLCISITGLTTLWLERIGNIQWRKLALVSLTLTFCSGLQAIGYWLIGLEFDLEWWIPNLYLLIYPIPFIVYFIKRDT